MSCGGFLPQLFLKWGGMDMTGEKKGRTIRLGTRKSRLAMAQTMLVSEAMKQAEPGLTVEIVPIVTTGDKILDRALTEFGGKGVFISEFESSILEGTIDAAVHSAKDMPGELSGGLAVTAVLPREEAEDVLVTVKDRPVLRSPMVIGTGSLRRQLQIPEDRNAVSRLLRGNVNTRLEKLYEGSYDGIILARAGLKRLGLFDDPRFSFEILPAKEFIPAGGQAIIAVEALKQSEFSDLFEKINDRTAELSLKAERETLRLLGAGCNEAVGVFSYMEGEQFVMQLFYQTETGAVRRNVSGNPEDYLALAEELTRGLRKNGFVFLVGAGPGDPKLLTLRGKEALSGAEVLVYDRLASPEFLKLVPDTCEKIYVGKEPGRHSMKQDEINQVLVRYALAGKKVVRLKGGDPFVFGRGGEEILELEKYRIGYEVVPGVTSAIAALSHAGIPVTHRGVAQSFHVITGHTAVRGDGSRNEDTLTEGFEAYAKLPGTLIFLMGLGNLKLIAERLIRCGKDPDTPAAVVTDGTLASMRCVRSTLKELPEKVKYAGLKAPGIIAVGNVTSFDMEYRKNLPLSGVTVGVTGTDAMFEKLSAGLSELGASAVRVGRLRVAECGRETLKEALASPGKWNWIVFTSQNSVKIFFDTVKEMRLDLRSFGQVRFAVIGRGTADCLEAFGIYADYIPDCYTTKALAEGLATKAAVGQRVLIPRAKQGSAALTEILGAAGLCCTDLPIYDVEAEPVSAECLNGLDYLTFESGSGVRGFFMGDTEEGKEKKCGMLDRAVCPVCIGHVTAAVLKQHGVAGAVIAGDYTAEGLCKAILSDINHTE